MVCVFEGMGHYLETESQQSLVCRWFIDTEYQGHEKPQGRGIPGTEKDQVSTGVDNGMS